jgi:adenylylsulfate kinase
VIERVLLVTGTVGVGKTTVAEAVSRQLAEARDPHAWVDLDKLSELWPPPEGDPFNTRMTAKNVRSVVANFARAGVRSLVLAGVVETQGDVALLEAAIGQRITIVRLTAAAGLIETRLRGRHRDTDPEGLAWHVARVPELDTKIDASGVPMAVVDNGGELSTTARAVLNAVGWGPSAEHPG